MIQSFAFLAQAQLDAVPASFVKWFFVSLFALLVIVGILVGIRQALREPPPQRINDDPPVEVRKAAKRYNHDATENRFVQVERRLDGHDGEISNLWNTMRSEDKELRRDMMQQFETISRALGRIEGKLEGRK